MSTKGFTVGTYIIKAEKKDWTKIKAEYGNWQADKNNTLPWEKFLALSEQE